MSCNYADGLSPYDNKGVLGLEEKFDIAAIVEEKCAILANWISEARHVVVHTGAGISTTAGIPDFRGPKGVWTLEMKGQKPNINISFDEAIPTKTHMALKKLVDVGYVHYIISQNIDGLHLRTGLPRASLAELHGNMFIEQCERCNRQFVRNSATTSVGQKSLEIECKGSKVGGRICRGKLHDTILDWEHSLPDKDLIMSDYHSAVADLNICLGTTLQIVPSGNLPLKSKKFGGRLVVVNLQPTKHDKKADLIINTYVDTVLEKVMKRLGLETPEFSKNIDPTKRLASDKVLEWTIQKKWINEIKQQHDIYCKKPKKPKLDCDTKTIKSVLKKEENFEVTTERLNSVKTEQTAAPNEVTNGSDEVIVIEDCKVEEVRRFIDFS